MEHVRTRPGMYIGRLGDGNLPEDGIYVLLKEVVDNSIDEFKMGAGVRLEIDIEDNLRHLQDYLQYFDRVRPRSGSDDMLSDPPALWSEPGARVRKADGNKCTRKTCK